MMRRRSTASLFAMLLVPVLPLPLQGAVLDGEATMQQQPAATGRISGIVTDAGTGAPLEAVQVSVAGTTIGTTTNAEGRYTIASVPAGAVTLQVRRIGYTAGGRSNVAVAAGQTATADFQLTVAARALDEVVVTGTAGGTQKRAIGNVVSTVNADSVLAVAPVGNINQLVGQRTAGVMMLPGTGQVGTGSAIRIRGSSSLSLSNEPIVYIDGVRMDSDAGRGPGQRGGANVSVLNDINPDDIESIEIIKGPAAATLYGTEASNGVVQAHIVPILLFGPRMKLRPSVTDAVNVAAPLAPRFVMIWITPAEASDPYSVAAAGPLMISMLSMSSGLASQL